MSTKAALGPTGAAWGPRPGARCCRHKWQVWRRRQQQQSGSSTTTSTLQMGRSQPDGRSTGADALRAAAHGAPIHASAGARRLLPKCSSQCCRSAAGAMEWQGSRRDRSERTAAASTALDRRGRKRRSGQRARLGGHALGRGAAGTSGKFGGNGAVGRATWTAKPAAAARYRQCRCRQPDTAMHMPRLTQHRHST